MTTQYSDKWWVHRWRTLLQQLDPDANMNGQLRTCRVKRMEISAGSVHALVQDRELGAVTVEIRLPTLDDDQWSQIIDALGSQAIFAAQLFAGNMPPEIEQIFAEAGTRLLPATIGEIEHSCSSCQPDQGPCRPLSAVYIQLTEMLAEDPWLLLRLRGRDRQQVMAAIHEKRNRDSGSVAAPTMAATPAAPSSSGAFFRPGYSPKSAQVAPEPLEGRIADFWGRRKVLEGVHLHLARPTVELALMRRLGPPVSGPDGVEALDQLQRIYRRVTDAAWSLAFAPEKDDEPPSQGIVD